MKFDLSKIEFNHYDIKRKIRLPSEPSVELAEFIGIVLGDGNVHLFESKENGKSGSIRITGDSRVNYLREYVSNLCKKLFNIKPSFYYFKNRNVEHLLLNGIIFIEYMDIIGLKHGSKIRNQSTIPNWIWQEKSLLKACIRGLIDTDGSIYELLPSWPGLFQLTFENRNKTLLYDLRKALLSLDFKVSKICGKRTDFGTKFYITRRDQIEKYLKEIGFSNIKHINRLKNYHSSVV